MQFLNDQKGLVKDNRIVVRRDWAKEPTRLAGAFGIARALAALARPAPAAARAG